MWLHVFAAALATLPAVDDPPRTEHPHADDAGLVIGVEDYFALPDVPYAQRDADAFYRFLIDTRGVPASRVQRLTGAANREQIEAAVERAKADVKPGGTVWFYFAGHGAASPTDGARLLLGVDAQADLATFEPRAVSVDRVKEQLSSASHSLVVVLDTCYTGQGRGGGDLVGGARFAVPVYASRPAPQTIEWSAAGPGQWSKPLDGARHGAFTYLVLGALRGWADADEDLSVTAGEADAYVRDSLRALQYTDQVPQLVGSPSFVLARGVTELGPVIDADDGESAAPEERSPSDGPRAIEPKKLLDGMVNAVDQLTAGTARDRSGQPATVQTGRIEGAAGPSALGDAIAARLDTMAPPEVRHVAFRGFLSQGAFGAQKLTVNVTFTCADGSESEDLVDKFPVSGRWDDDAAPVTDALLASDPCR